MGIAQTRGQNLDGGWRGSVGTNIAFSPTKTTEILVPRHICWAQSTPIKYFFSRSSSVPDPVPDLAWKAYSALPNSLARFRTALRWGESDIKLSKHITADYSLPTWQSVSAFATCWPSSFSGQQMTATFGKKSISNRTQHYDFLGYFRFDKKYKNHCRHVFWAQNMSKMFLRLMEPRILLGKLITPRGRKRKVKGEKKRKRGWKRRISLDRHGITKPLNPFYAIDCWRLNFTKSQ